MAVVLVTVKKVDGTCATSEETGVLENKLKATHEAYLRSDRSQDAFVLSHLQMRVNRYMFEESPSYRVPEVIIEYEERDERDERDEREIEIIETSSSSSESMPEYDIVEEVEID